LIYTDGNVNVYKDKTALKDLANNDLTLMDFKLESHGSNNRIQYFKNSLSDDGDMLYKSMYNGTSRPVVISLMNDEIRYMTDSPCSLDIVNTLCFKKEWTNKSSIDECIVIYKLMPDAGFYVKFRNRDIFPGFYFTGGNIPLALDWNIVKSIAKQFMSTDISPKTLSKSADIGALLQSNDKIKINYKYTRVTLLDGSEYGIEYSFDTWDLYLPIMLWIYSKKDYITRKTPIYKFSGTYHDCKMRM
jgi:hypothetical protein